MSITSTELAAVTSSTVPTGQTIVNTLPTVPSGYLLCDGSAVSRSTYSALFSAVGTRFGVGDGSTTFNVPNFPVNIGLGNFNSTALPAARFGHSLTMLADGRLLVIGGNNAGTKSETYFGVIANGAITWTSGTALPAARYLHTATLLGDGRVLVIAGADTADTAQKNTYFGTISGDTISWANGTDITTTMYEHTATLLQDGRVMTVGGVNAATSNTNLTYFGTISSNTITWAAGTVYGTVIAGATANLLPNGHVLVCGGTNGSPVTTTNFLSISTNTITYTAGTVIPATFATGNSVMLPDGQVLLVGGIGGAASQKCYSASISEPDLVWNQAKSMTITRRLSGVVVSGNRLVIVGGSSSSTSAVVEMIPLEVKIIKT